MIRKFGKIFGIVMILLGILGFLPKITERHLLLGIFEVNSTLNFVHLITGLLAYLVSRIGINIMRLFFQIFAVMYSILGFLGFAYTSKPIFRVIANNTADDWLHLLIAGFCIFIGFIFRKEKI